MKKPPRKTAYVPEAQRHKAGLKLRLPSEVRDRLKMEAERLTAEHGQIVTSSELVRIALAYAWHELPELVRVALLPSSDPLPPRETDAKATRPAPEPEVQRTSNAKGRSTGRAGR